MIYGIAILTLSYFLFNGILLCAVLTDFKGTTRARIGISVAVMSAGVLILIVMLLVYVPIAVLKGDKDD